MDFFQLLLIAIVQGITEFLPISSSGHLILIPFFTEFSDQGPLIDIAVHVGSLLAIIIYFWRDAIGLVRGGLSNVGLSDDPQQKSLFWWIVIGTIPAVILGGVFYTLDVLENFRSTTLVGINLIVFGILLGVADQMGRQEKTYEQLTLRDAVLVGLAQAMALIPGTSRSGVTMTMARFLGYKRVEAARFSFLLSMPAVAGAGVLIAFDLAEATAEMQMDALIAGGLTFVSAFLTMAFLMNFLKKASMMVFVVYRVLLGAGLLFFM